MNRRHSIEADPSASPRLRPHSSSPTRAESILSSIASLHSDFSSAKRWKHSRWRHTVGIISLLVTVILWTTSNFLASTIFADNTYSKPYFVTYVNSSFFCIPLIPLLIHQLYQDPSELATLKELIPSRLRGYSQIPTSDEEGEGDAFLKPDDAQDGGVLRTGSPSESMVLEDDPVGSQVLEAGSSVPKLNILDTAKLSLEFCFIWFVANYFTAGCLEYTTVASSTILTSTSSIWTLIVGTIWGVERFTIRKLLGVLASLTGIIFISTVDMSGETDKNRGTFPHKTPTEIAIGDAMAIFSALLYGIYAIVMKKRIGDESRVNMPLFFGMVGLMNVLLLWPGFIILHLVGIETFELPPKGKVLTIILVNSTSSLVSDFCWAYAMLLTSPLIVTVGLSLTIPLSLIGQIILDSQYSSVMYWFGAVIVLLSFIFINHEENKDEEAVMATSGILREETLTGVSPR